MLSHVKQTLKDHPKLVHSIIVLILGSLGFTFGTEVKEQFVVPAPDVDIEVIIPEQPAQIQHSHPQHSHKDWLPVIRAEIQKEHKAHSDAHH